MLTCVRVLPEHGAQILCTPGGLRADVILAFVQAVHPTAVTSWPAIGHFTSSSMPSDPRPSSTEQISNEFLPQKVGGS